MASHSKRRKKFSVAPASRPNSDINVTPLVDVVLVLLIIFMVVTPLMEKDLDVRVPETEKTELLEDIPKDQLVVSLSAEGDLSINSEQVPAAEYVAKLRRILAARPSGERLVFFMPEGGANYGKVVAALDGARRAGAETLGMMTEPLEDPPDATVSPQGP